MRGKSNWETRTTLAAASPLETRPVRYPTMPTAFRKYWGAKLYMVQNCRSCSERNSSLARLVIQIVTVRFDPHTSMRPDIEAKWTRGEQRHREHRILALIFHALPYTWAVVSINHRVGWLECKRRLGNHRCPGKSLIPNLDSQSAFRQMHQPSLPVNAPIRLAISKPSHC
jgi:hypothetical protein